MQLWQLLGIDEAGRDEIPGCIDKVLEVTGDDDAVTQVDSKEVVLEEEVDNNNVVMVESVRTGIFMGR